MNIESKIDDKGRVEIPKIIRKRLNIRPGDRLFFQLQGNKILIRKFNSIEDFVTLSEEFSKKLKEATDEPIKFKKLVD